MRSIEDGRDYHNSSDEDISSADDFSSDDDIIITSRVKKDKYHISNALKLVNNMVEQSQLSPIVQIRRDPAKSSELKTSLTKLVSEATLDREQLESFIKSLTHPVHLTQGPPGTGKSYLGVVLVRALLIIREIWIEVCPTVGLPPILVLSYKNHAIDEFLCDLVEKEKSGSRKNLSMIRIGGSCDEPRLNPYSEKNQPSYRCETEAAKNNLQTLHQHRVEQTQQQNKLSPLVVFESIFCNPEDPNYKILSNEATLYLSNLIVKVANIKKYFEEEDSEENVTNLTTLWNDNFPGGMEDHLNLSDIESLWIGVKHYNIKQPIEIIYKWIMGMVPLAQCSSRECLNQVPMAGFEFCTYHLCHCAIPAQCYRPRKIDRFLCEEHACQEAGCGDVKLPSPQIYCIEHACTVCVTKNFIAQLGTDMAPRNTCVAHPLCISEVLDGYCLSLALPNLSFCEEHKSAICSATTSKGQACKEYVMSRGNLFCKNHQVIITIPKKEVIPKIVNVSKCKATTKKNKPCKSKPLDGYEYCKDHKEKYKAKPIATTEKEDVTGSIEVEKSVEDNIATITTKEATIDGSKVSDAFLSDKMIDLKSTEEDGSETTSPADNPTDSITIEDEAPLPDESDETVNEEEEEESDQLQHIREVYMVDDQTDELLKEVKDCATNQDEKEEEEEVDEEKPDMVASNQWTWEMSLEQRWDQCKLLEKTYLSLMQKINQQRNREIEVARQDYHNAKIRAKSLVYEGKAVIGGTIVGCIARLEAIRNSKPFAILVEEASEVLEPLLFSCLSESTCKLEMIGDHLQLQPSIMSKIEFERINSINVSMFERLINAPDNYSVPSTALATQRRMRKNICDLTRYFYEEIVEIEDHEICNTKKIADGLKYSRNVNISVNKLKRCLGKGREVPGVLPHVFFWTHKGAQTKAHVGLSRINKLEADMAVGLTQYLVECGVPKPSIAILTPYKGQLMLMRKDLVNKRYVDKFKPKESVIVSTVDRFQGDEADIVIISLVIDAKSHTPFVKKVNRMIVLLSRARIGMFILGNVGYFEEKPDPSISHWSNTLEKLREPAEQDTDETSLSDDIDDLTFTGSRLGDKLPICCPIHRYNSLEAGSVQQLKLNFCDEKCLQRLPCSHACGIPCHFETPDNHNTACSVLITPSPCDQHRDDVTCFDVFQNVKAAYTGRRRGPIATVGSFEDALKKYRCQKKVDVQLPCTHTVKMTCAEESDIASNVTTYPECKQLALAPYSYPVCGHELTVLCCVWYEYKKDPSKVKVCKEKVMYTPTCAHQVQMDCYLKLKIDSQQQEFHCTKMMDITLPRCGHKQNVSCDKAQTIAQWKGNACEPGIVREGQSYGPIDHICKQEIRYVRVCGHETTMPCQMAFQQAPNIVNCTVDVKVTNPECGHPAVVACHINKQLLATPTTKPPVTEVREGHSAIMFGNPILHLNCETQVSLRRRCGHIETLKCCQARDEHVQPCKAVITVINPICGHETKLPCHKQTEFFNWNPWPNGVTYKEILYDDVLEDTVPPPSMLPLELEGFVKPCNKKIHVLRQSCEHMYEQKCGTAFFDVNTKVTSKCMDTIDGAKLNCGHEATMKCSVYTVYKQNPKTYQCKKDVLLQCWNFVVCKNVVKSKCNLIGTPVPCGNIANWTCSVGHVTQNLPLCEKGIPTDCPECIVNKVEKEVKTPSELKTTLPRHLLKCKQEKVVTSIKLQVFNHSKSILLNRYIEWLKKCTLLFRPLYTPKLIPCFHYEEFKMKLTTLSCCQVYEWTSRNIKNIIQKAEKNNGDIKLYFGIAFCARVTTNPKDRPGKKQRNSLIIQTWAKEKINLGFDSVQVNVNQMDELYLLAPHAAICTHKVTVKLSELQEMLKNTTLESQVFKQEFIKYVLPENRSSLLAQVPTETLNHKDERLAKVQLNWNGEDLGSFEEHIQKELISKLRFCLFMSGSDEGSLFGGRNYLKQLSKELKVVEIPLLLALEEIKLGDFETALVAYKEYLRIVKETKSKKHPLVILVEARFHHKNNKKEEEINLLKLFEKSYPHAVENWFEEYEDDLLEGKGGSESVRTEEDVRNEIRNKWQMLKDEENVQSEAMDKLIELTGLKKVKNFAIDLFKSAIKFNQMDESFRKANPKTLNFCFLGNAGSGKTTVARLLAKILNDSKMRVTDNFMETSAQKLKDDGPEKFRELADSAKDGTLFIDEAYDLDPKADFKGKPIVTELLTISENCRENLSIILAGYEDDMEEKLFSHNEGIKSRFQMVHFEDFDEEDLKAIWDHEVKTRMFTCDDVVGTIVAKRLAKLSGKKGFGNARAVRNEVEKATGIAMAREDFDSEKKELIARDVMGELPTNNPKLKAVLNEFDTKVGWKSIKDSVQQLIKTCEKNYELQLSGMKTSPVMLNRLFLGNPGTGKTTCGKLYGRLLKQLNFLSVGDVVVKAASDFKGAHVGESETKTNAILSQARGKVLLIDEAYSLDDNLYGKQVLDVLVEKVQNSENDDIAVLLLGYEKQMREMLRNQNPGLARRFAMDYAFKFNDYTESELYVILQGVCKRENIKLTSEVAELIMKQLEKQRSQANFGNAGAIDNIVRSALSKASIRPLSADRMIKLIPSDVSSDDMQVSTKDPLLPLKKLFKMEKIEQQIVEIKNTFQVAEAEGSKDKPVLGHFVFRGSPGTGKTTVARVMAEILYSLGLIARKHVEQTSGLEMTGEYVGHTKKRVQEKLDAARGGVLFIDEAYELGKGSFGEEAITTLVAAMTDPDYRLVIIIAGYPKDMEQMLARNIGLKSRFKRFMDFIDWDSDDCIKFLKQKASNDNYILHEDAILELKQGIDKLCKFRGWGNARDAIAIWDALNERRANRVVNSPETKKSIALCDAETAMSEMIKDRTPKVSDENILEQLLLESQKQLQQKQKTDMIEPPPIQKQNLSTKVAEEKPCEDPPEEEKARVEVERDPGVTDEIWQQLLLDKLLAEKEEDDRLEEIEKERRLQEEKERLLEELRKRLAEEQEEEKRLQQELKLKQQQELERKRKEYEANRRREKERAAAAIQEKLRRIGNCPAGFLWIKQSGGWRCSAGGHFVNDKELNDNYTY